MKKIGCLLAILAICAAVLGTVSAAEATAAEIAPQVTDEAGNRYGALEDKNRNSKLELSAQTLTITADERFYGVYLIWDQPPGAWSGAADGTAVSGGENGFLHEYVPLESGCNTLTITPQAGALCCDIYLFGAGELPDWVQRWQPPLEDADLLLLPTHADDEHLYFGGTMPYYAGELQKKVQVVYFTNHWAEPYRPHELLDGLWTVGVTAYPVFSDVVDRYADSIEQARAMVGEEEGIAFQVEQLRRFKPEVVIGHDLNGEYGHGMHKFNAYTLQQALELSGDPQQFPDSAAQYGAWEVPKAYLHLYPENQITMDWDIPLERFEGKTALEMAVLGFAEHRSQQTYFKVEDFGPYDCRLFGLCHSTVGADVQGGDFFENLAAEDYSDYVAPTPTPTPTPAATPQPTGQPEPPKKDGNEINWMLPAAAALVVLGAAVLLVYRRNRR